MTTMMLAQSNGVSAGMIIGAVLLALVVAFCILVAKIMLVGNPSEMLIISGKRQKDGLGYRTLIGGRTLVIPIIEKVSRLSLRNMQVQLDVSAQAGGGTMVPVTVSGVANVKVSSDPGERANAIERFLDQPAIELQRVSRETLEGGLRAVIGKMTPEEIVEDRDKFVSTVMHEVSDDFRKLGLLIDSVNIQNVQDSQQYLESISRKATASVLAAARKSEAEEASLASIREAQASAAARQAAAERDAEAKTAEAASRQSAEQARLVADKAIAESENELRIRKAELAQQAAIKETAEQEAAAKAEEARLNATDVQAANAKRDVAHAKAEGEAASILEEGRARAAAIDLIGQAIQKHPDALQVMLLELMPSIVDNVAKSVNNIALGEVTVFDSGKGDAIAGAAMGRAKALGETLGMLESIVGVDFRQLGQGIAAKMTNGHHSAEADLTSADVTRG